MNFDGLSVGNIFIDKKPMPSFFQYVVPFVLGIVRIGGIPRSTNS